VRIGVDMLGIQEQGASGRAMAGYARGLVSALLQSATSHEFFLYAHDEYPQEAIPGGPRATVVLTNSGARPGETTPGGRLERLAAANPDRLDWLVVLDPLAPALGMGPPARPLCGLKLAAVVPDLTPFVVPERDLTDPVQSERGYRALGRLRQYDAILTPSLTTRDNVLALLGLPPERVFAIGHAADGLGFRPEESLPMPLEARRVLHGLGIRRAFLLVDPGYPGQKTVERMLDVYRMLPEHLRLGYQIVFTGPRPASPIDGALSGAESPGGETFLFTGAVSEAALRPLLQHCAVFIYPALNAGFGQPILEAMLCGAVVVAGNNSVQVELVRDAGLLADPADPGAMAAQIHRILDDWTVAQSLRSRAAAHVRQFTFESAATATLRALAQSTEAARATPTLRADRRHPRQFRARSRPRIAFFSPLPPRISGIADYAARLLDELKATYTIDLYHDAGYVPELGLSGHDFAAYDGRLFERNHAVLNYHATVYQMGNSVAYHGYLYDRLLRHPGVVTLHDFFLSVYPYGGTRTGDEVLASFSREIRHFCPDRADEFLPHLSAWCGEEGGLAAACARRSLYLNRRVFERSLGVAVHSPWCLEQVQAWMPEHVAKTTVIPLGTAPRGCTAVERAAIRDRFALPRDALIVASVGFIHPDKLVNEAIEAFRSVAEADPTAVFLGIGDECDGGLARQHARALGLAERVRWLGRQPAADYADLIAAIDVGVNLRRPPTNGETSAALLDLLATGVATIVTDVATFADYPDTVVRKVRWDDRGPEALRGALSALARDRSLRQELGNAAQTYVRRHHAWANSAAAYVELIERCAEGRHGTASMRHDAATHPHSAVPAEVRS
jgi:glycosyltransferase involved in cell wall biosynthesis